MRTPHGMYAEHKGISFQRFLWKSTQGSFEKLRFVYQVFSRAKTPFRVPYLTDGRYTFFMATNKRLPRLPLLPHFFGRRVQDSGVIAKIKALRASKSGFVTDGFLSLIGSPPIFGNLDP